MALIKNPIKIVLCTVCVWASAPSWAQEVIWFVENSVPSEITPLYEGSSNPFPTYTAPVIMEQKIDDLDGKQKSSKDAAAAQILEKIRANMNSGQFRVPSINDIVVRGYVKTPNGQAKVLIDNDWKGVGSIVNVTAKEVKQFKELFAELAVLRPSAAEEIEQEMEEKMKLMEIYELRIVNITQNKLELKDSHNQTYAVRFTLGD